MSTSHKTIPSLFEYAADRHGDRIAFNYFDGSWKTMTYGEFSALVEVMTSVLLEKGLGKGEGVAIVSENRPEWCASYLAALSAQGIVIPLDMQLGQEEVRNLLADSDTRIVCCSSKTEATVLRAIETTNIKSLNFDLHTPQPASLSTRGDALPQASPEDVAALIYTSGTTGNPKGVMLTHRNLCSDAEAVVRLGIVNEHDNVLAMLPLHHTYPCMCTFLVPLSIGAAITFAPGLKANELMSAIRDRDVTVVVSVPRLLEMIRDGIISKMRAKGSLAWPILLGLVGLCQRARRAFDLNIGRALFRSVHRNFGVLRFFASGGAKLDPSVMADLEALGFTILEGYGLTETSPVITFNPLGKRKPGSAGRPLPDVEIRVADDGEIMAKGPMVMKGYYKNEQATRETFRDGWLLTGDTGFLDNDGYLFITGRKKEVIVLSSGKNVYPEDVEKAYGFIPLIKELCVTGIDRRGVTDSLHAVIVPDLDYVKSLSIGNISETLKWEINEVSGRLPEYMRIRGFTLSTEPLPRTPLGKLRRFMVAETAQGHKPMRPSPQKEDLSLTGDEIGKRVVDCIRSVIGEPVPVQSTDNLELDLGFDSLKKIEFITCLEASLSIDLPETFATEIQTVGDVVSRVRRYVSIPALATAREERGKSEWKDILRRHPSSDDITKVGLSPSLAERALVPIPFMLHKILFRLLFRLRVEGLENIPSGGPFVIAANHASYLDAFAIGASVSYGTFRKLSFLGLERFFRGGLRSWFARLSHVIPIDLETYLTRALQLSAYTLNQGRALCIFPEGGRSSDGTVMQFKKGIGVLAKELAIPVIPAFISGTHRALPKGARFVRLAQVGVHFGRPLTPADLNRGREAPAVDPYQFFADELRARVLLLSGMDKRPESVVD